MPKACGESMWHSLCVSDHFNLLPGNTGRQSFPVCSNMVGYGPVLADALWAEVTYASSGLAPKHCYEICYSLLFLPFSAKCRRYSLGPQVTMERDCICESSHGRLTLTPEMG